MPATAAAAPHSCRASPPGELASRSANTAVPIRTAEIGSTVSMIGKLVRKAPAW
jgi:hypothetical protein